MRSIWIPLGLIVDTNSGRSREAFKTLFEELRLGIDIDALLVLLETSGKFQNFNLGQYDSEQAFADDLLDIITLSIPAGAKPIHNWRDIWEQKWKQCWNAQSTVNDQAIELLRMITENNDPNVNLVIFSETNSAHYEQFRKKCTDHGILLGKLNLHASHLSLMPVDEMMLAHAEAHLDQVHTRIKRNADLIEHPTFRKMAVAKDMRISIMLEGHGVKVRAISEAQLNPERLQAIMIGVKYQPTMTQRPRP